MKWSSHLVCLQVTVLELEQPLWWQLWASFDHQDNGEVEKRGLSNICQDVPWSIGIDDCVISNWLILRVCASAMEYRIGRF